MKHLLLALLSACLPYAASAHTDAYFDAIDTPHHGQMRTAGPYHLELVVAAREWLLYVADHANGPIEVAGASALAEVTHAGKVHTVQFAPSGANVLRADVKLRPGRQTTIAITLRMPGQEPQTAVFRPARKASAKSQH